MRKFTQLFIKFLPLLFALCGLFAVNEAAYAAWTGSGQGTKVGNTWYVVYDEDGGNLTKGQTKDYNLLGPGASLTFQAKREPSGTGNLLVTQNSGSTNLYEGNPGKTTKTGLFGVETGTDYDGYSASVSVSSTIITFKNNASITANTKKYYKNVKVTMAQYINNPTKTDLDCGTADINSESTSGQVNVAWCNVPAMSYEITDDAEGLFSVSVDVNSEAGKYNTSHFTVTYKHTKAGTHTAKLKITDTYNSYSKTVNLTGTTNKLQPTVTWSPDEAIFNVDDELSATNGNDLTVTLSGNSTYVTCTGNTAVMKAATSGTITITAHVTGNDIYADKDITKDITITNLEKQHITWTDQDFSRLKTTDGSKSITLSATASSGLPVSYELIGDKTGLTLTQSGNTWTLTYSATECKNTTIVAKQAGNATYAPASSVSLPVKVIDPTKVCDVNNTLISSDIELKNTYTTCNLDIPSTIRINVKRTRTNRIYSNGFDVEFYTGKNGTGEKVGDTHEYGASAINTSKTIEFNNLSRTIKSVKLISHASNGYTVTSVIYTQQKYCEISKSSLAFETYPNTATSAKTFVVNYANYPITLESSNSKFTVTPVSFGDCGEHDEQIVSVTYTAGPDEGDDSGVIYIKDNTGVTLQTCSLSVEISKLTQSITSTSIKSSYNTTDRIELSAEANSGLTAFTYSATPAGIASFDGNVMTFSQSGTIAITATQPGSNVYAAASTTVNGVQVNKVTPNIETNPTVAEIKYKGSFANNQLSEGLATVTLRGVENTPVAGTFTWTSLNGTTVNDAAGSHNYSVKFTPTNGGMYNSKTFTQSVTISRADGDIEMNNGEVLVKVAGINDNLNECKIDLDDLIQSKIEDAVANRAGAVSYEVISANKANAAIDGDNKFSATQAGSYTIRATQAQTDYYEEATDEFTVTVNKLTPTIVFDNTENPEYIYSGDVIEQPAYRMYNGNLIDRVVNYISSDPSINGAIHVEGTTLTARDVTAQEGSAVEVTITASTDADALYEAVSAGATHNYAVRAKRSTYFWLDGDIDATAKTLSIGETAEITYNENVDENFTISTALSYITYVHDAEHRKITVTAQKGTLVGDGEQKLTVDQQGGNLLFGRNKVYTFTVKKNVSALSLDDLTTSMNVEDTVATPYTGLANTSDAVNFSCSPEGSMKYEDGKLIALQAGTNTVTFSQPATEFWTGISRSKTITVSKKNPNITTALSNRHPWYAIIEHPFSSLNTEKALSITSSNETLAKYIAEEDKIYVYGTSGNVTFTVNQEANYKYNAVENYQKTFEIFQPNNRLQMVLTESNLSDYNGGGAGGVKWNSGGVEVGNGNGFNYDDKYVILKFVGIPETLSFDFETTSWAATDINWYFEQSSNGKDWSTLKTSESQIFGGVTSGSETFHLNPDTRYVKLCYSGNFNGRFKNVSITERKEIVPQAATTDFGLGYNGNEPTTRTIKVDWYNVKPCTVTITGTDADKFIMAEGSKAFNSQLDHYGTAELLVSYKHETNTATSHTATLHIEDEDGYYANITLTGQTTPAPQEIIWREDLTPMPLNGVFPYAVMVASNQPITLTSDHENIVRVDANNTLVGVAAGNARVTAVAEGNTKWAETTSYIDIEVTTKNVQFITWNDYLSNRKREDGKTVEIELTATSSADLPITYELDEAAQAFASIDGNTLSLTGWGKGQVIAKQAGNENYVAVQAVKSLVSRNPAAGCRPLVGEYAAAYTLHTIAEKAIDLSGEAGTIEFDAKCDWDALYGLWVEEYYDGYWHGVTQINRLDENGITSTESHFGPYNLTRRATAVKLLTKTGATMTRTFRNLEVTLAKYLELEDNHMDFSQVDKGSNKTQSFYINYSNITGVLDVTLENASTQFEVVTETVGEDCGDFAKNARVDIRFTGKTLGTEENAIIVSNTDQSLRIPVSATVVLPSQTITWEPELNVLTTDDVVLSATATSELPVSFTSGNTDIAQIAYEAGVYSLDIKSYGDVEITAHQAGNDDWSAATDKTLTFHISRVIPTILAYPTATGVVLPNTLAASTLQGGSVEGNIEGTFRWLDATQNVTKGVTSYKAVFDPENDDYYETVEFDVEIEILKTPQTITWNRDNETEEWCASVIALDATTDSNLPITYHSSDSTIAYHENGNLKVLKFGTVTITAEQKGDDTYAAAESVTKTITLKRNILTLPEISVTPVYVHHFLSNSTFPTEINAMAGEVEVGGTFQWKTPDMLMDNPGPNNCTAVFTPNNENLYEPKEFVMSVEVLRFAPTINHNFTTEAADYGVKISELVLNGSGSAVDGYDPGHPGIDGTFEWKTPNHVPLVRETSAILVFRPTRSDWYDEVELSIDITINSIGYIFTGDGEWGADENWAEGEAPENVEDVIIQGNVIISGEVEVGGLTIEGGSTVTLAVDGVLTVNGESADRDLYGDVNVYNNGQLILNEDAELKVNNFTLEAILGNTSTAANSGQVDGAEQLNVNGDAYFKLALDPAGAITYGWYDFVVPFEVDVVGGIFEASNLSTPLTNGWDYAVMSYDESKRAVNGKDWNKYSGTMEPGRVYTITVDYRQGWNTIAFKKKKGASVSGDRSFTTSYSEVGETVDRGWNGFGNGSLLHTELNVPEGTLIQIYDHANKCYQPREAKDCSIAVGTSFFMQVDDVKIITLDTAKNNAVFLAPSRQRHEVEQFRLALTAEGEEIASDHLWISASEDATGEYVIGRDLLKMGTPTESNVARFWAARNEMRLCDIEMQLANNNAQCELGLFAPQAKEYTLSVETTPEDAVLYLTYNGRAIWNLTNSPYVFDLTKGTTEGYGLRIYAVPQVTTDLEQSEFSDPSSVRKVLIDDVIYIITPEGKMYDITGKSMNY